jgi:splicing factor 3B subunit 4
MSGARHWEQDKEATVYIGNLDERVTDALVWELMLQAGRIVRPPSSPLPSVPLLSY